MGNFFGRHFGKMAFISINSLLILTGVLVIKNRADEKNAQNSPEFSEVGSTESVADALNTASENIKADTAAVASTTEQNKTTSLNPANAPVSKPSTPVVKPKPVVAPAPAPKPAKKTKTS